MKPNPILSLVQLIQRLWLIANQAAFMPEQGIFDGG
jgi:hypothetical protein